MLIAPIELFCLHDLNCALSLLLLNYQSDMSTLGSAFCKDECTVINIGDPDGAPRLVCHY